MQRESLNFKDSLSIFINICIFINADEQNFQYVAGKHNAQYNTITMMRYERFIIINRMTIKRCLNENKTIQSNEGSDLYDTIILISHSQLEKFHKVQPTATCALFIHHSLTNDFARIYTT